MMTTNETKNALFFVYDKNTPRDIKQLLRNKYPSAETCNIDEIESLKNIVIRREEAQAVCVVFDGSVGKRTGAFRKENLQLFKEAMGVYFETNVIFAIVFTEIEASKTHVSDEEGIHNRLLTNDSPIHKSQVDEGPISDWFSDLLARTCNKCFVRIDSVSTEDFDNSVSNITFIIKSFDANLSLICKLCIAMGALVIAASCLAITCYNIFNNFTCKSS